MPKVGVVLINWNGAELTIPCIASLQKGSVRPDCIIVVDNASSDDSAETIALRCPEVEMVKNTDNRGFAGGNNVGILKLMRLGMDYVWILNNDTEVDVGCLQEFLGFMERYQDAAACGGKVFYHHPKDKIWYAGSTFNRWMFRAKHKRSLEKDAGRFDQAVETPFITGCSMFVRKNVLERVGVFDERFFAYSEDLDWCLRAREKGFRLFFVPGAFIYHKVSSSFTKKPDTVKGFTTPLMIELTYRNRLYLLRKHLTSKAHLLILFVLLILKAGAYSTILMLLGRFNKSKAVWKGIRAGMASY